MLGLLFAAVLACPISQHPCDDDVNDRAAAPAYAPAYHDNRAHEERRYDDQRYDDRRYQDQDYRRHDNDRRYDQDHGQTVVRETTTADGAIRETWGPRGYVRETFGFDDLAGRPAYDQRADRDDRPGDRGPAPGVYDRYGAPYQGDRYYGRSDAYSSSYDPNCNCDCPPGVTAAPVVERETVDIRGWGLVGGVAPDGDYYSGGGGGGGGGSGGVDMNGLAYGGGSGFGRGSASSSASASASASVSVRTSVGVHIMTGGGGHHGGGSGGCNCTTGHSGGGGKRY